MAMTVSHPLDTDNFTCVKINDNDFYFSYKTCIAFQLSGHLIKACENVWSTTTGKHLNYVCSDKKKRIPYDDFMQLLNAIKINVEQE